MVPSAAPCVKARPLFLVLSLALACDAMAQANERDALIQELRQRIEALERKLEEKPAPPPPPTPKAAPPPAPVPKPTASEEAGRDDDAARALERTLVREGGLVLPRGAIEVEPRLEYTYRGSEGLGIVGAGPLVAQQDIRSNELEASLGIRIGLPASFQAEIRVPYRWLDENRVISGAVAESGSVSGWGDLEVGLAKQLVVERRGAFGLLGSINWKSTTGKHELGRLSPGTGFPQLQGALTAVKREDPLVFFGTASYTRIFERERSGSDVDPGDGVGLRTGALLAASPETSLRAAFDLSRFGRTRIGGADVPGSDTTVGMLELGLATLLTRRTLLDIDLGIGVTPDAPDFRVRLALPIRF